jgi:hypothetical protein
LGVGGRAITEFPLTTFEWAGLRLPVAGGGYFRLLPYAYTSFGFERANSVDGMPGIFYLHPWEIDVDQPRLPGSLLSRFRHYTNLHRCEARLQKLLRQFRFGRACDVLEQLELPFVASDALLHDRPPAPALTARP